MNLLRLLAFVLASAALTLAQEKRPVAAPLAQEYTVVFRNPDPEYYVEGPGLMRFDDGSLLAVVPVVPREQWSEERRLAHSVVHLLRSSDRGATWEPLADLPYYSAAPWRDGDTLYLFANKPGIGKKRNADLLLLRSDDRGRTWSAPVTLFTGNYWNCHTAMVQRDRRIYWAVDDLSLGKKRGPRLVAGDFAGDPMNPQSWRISEPLPFSGAPEALWNPKFAAQSDQWLEPNVIEVNGQLRVLMTVKLKRQATANLCAVLDATDTDGQLALKFIRFNSMPGGQLKFCVLRDDATKLFWLTSNLPVASEDTFGWSAAAEKEGHFKSSAGDRRTLMLSYGADGLNWFPAGCIAQAPKLSQSFMYARPMIDGDDLAIIARSSIDAPNQHDADCATFHRVRDFRRLALGLHPQTDEK